MLSTPHRVRLADREHFTPAYFHEPRFDARMRPLRADPYGTSDSPVIHYGEHFTRMFMRCCPRRATTLRIEERGLLRQLASAR